jgi:hypothetical protein
MKGTRYFFLAVGLLLLCSAAMATDVTFQVNMVAQARLSNFLPATDSVCVRGSFQLPPPGWAGWDNKLTDANNDTIYTGTFSLPDTSIEYKFVMDHNGTTAWESIADNRTAVVAGTPLVLPVVYFSNIEPVLPENLEVLFRVNMHLRVLSGDFDPVTDIICVRGGNDSLGNWGGLVALTLETGSQDIYSRWIRMPNVGVGVPIQYKFFNAIDGNPNQNEGWEQLPAGGNRNVTPTGTEPDVLPPPNGNGFQEILPTIVYFNDADPANILTQDVNVTFRVDIRSLLGKIRDRGFVTDVGGTHITEVTEIDVVGWNGWPWGNIPEAQILNDLGQNGDGTAQDTIWSRTILFRQNSEKRITYKFGVNQLDAEARSEHNHVLNIDDSSPTFLAPVICFGMGVIPEDTLFTDWAHLCLPTAVDEEPGVLPDAYRLDQNYPNPFNPVTNITFALPKDGIASIRVYDIMGRTVATLIDGRMAAGQHTIAFDASKLATGVYFYRLEAGSFMETRKLLLLK